MNRRQTIGIVVTGLVLVGWYATRRIDPPDLKVTSDRLNALASEFRKLRRIKGHFSGGQWDDRVDSYNGRMHAVMKELEETLRGKRIPQPGLETLLGPPNAVEVQNGEEVLLYYWRGRHDYLIISHGSDGAIHSRWYYALE